MDTDYWKTSPFGENSIFHPNFDKKDLKIRYLQCEKDDTFTYLHFEITARNLSSEKATLIVVESEVFRDEKIISQSITISRNGTKYFQVKFSEKKLSKTIFEGDFEFKATIICDGLSATTGEFRIACTEKQDSQKTQKETPETKFKKLYTSGELSPEEIKEYRIFISTLQEDKKNIWYLELQKHVPYHSQIDNDNEEASKMCNMTSLAMNLECLGIECPDSTMQFEDWLDLQREKNSYGSREDSNSWIKLAKDLGVKSEYIGIWTKKSDSIETIKEIVFNKIKPYIDNGHSVSVSAFTIGSKKGHIVRLQSVNEDGIVVDDPNGRVNNFQKRENGGSGYTGSKNSKDNLNIFGKDNLWRWVDIKICTIKYIVVFYKTENEND